MPSGTPEAAAACACAWAAAIAAALFGSTMPPGPGRLPAIDEAESSTTEAAADAAV